MNTGDITSSLEEVIGLDGPPRPLAIAIEAILIERFDLPAIQAAERADRFQEKVAVEIARREAHLSASGGAPTLRLVGATMNVVAGYCHSLASDGEDVVEFRKKRSNVQAILNRIRALSFNDFEKFGARFLRELGARIGDITPQSNDQGIDFYGEFSLSQLHQAPDSFLVLAKDVRLLFAGQAKHYPTRSIGPSTVRELIGALSLARTKTHSTDGVDIFGGLPIRPFSPVVALLFTTGELTTGAARLAEAAGIIAKTGLQLAVFLADRGVGLIQNDAGFEYSEQAFSDWLSQA